MTAINNLSDIVNNGLCIGCGVCQSITGKDKISYRPSHKRSIQMV
jgi:coenzyme F420 hydrogenase subunit beta